MAETEQLVVALEARIRDFERNFQKASRTANDNWRNIESRGNRAARNVETGFQNASRGVVRSIDSMGAAIPKALAGLSAAISVEAVRRYADAWTTASNKIVAAGTKLESANFTTGQIADIAQRSRSDFGAVADLFARLTRASAEFKASQMDVAKVTETVAKALKLSGASAAETESTLVQLGQGLSSGKLQGDELRSLLENAPVVAAAIAKEFGVAVGALKDIGAKGELEASRIFRALKNAGPEIEKQFAQTTATTTDALKAIEAAAIKFVGTSGAVKTAMGAMGSGMNAVAKNFDTLATGAAALGIILTTRLIAAGLTPAALSLLAMTRASAAAVPALTALNFAMASSVISANAGMLAMRGLSGALALVGGPAGAAILGIGAAAFYFSARARDAEERAKQYADALERVRVSSDAAALSQRNLGDEIQRTAAKQFEAQRNDLNKQLVGTQNDVKAFAANVESELRRAASVLRSRGLSSAAGSEMDALRERFKNGELSAQQLRDEIFKLANSNPSFQGLADRLGPLLQKLAGAIALANELRAKLTGVASAQSDAARAGLEARIPNPTAGTNYDADAGMINRDPLVREIVGQGIAQRAVIEAQMDETKKKVRDKYIELRDEILGKGGTIDPDALRKQAAAIIAADDSDSGSGKSAKSEKKNEFDRAETASQRRTRELEAERAAIGLSALEAAKATESYRLMDAAKAAGLPVTAELTAKIEKLAGAYAGAKVAVDKARKAQEQAKQQSEFFKSSIGDALSDAIIEGKSLDEVFRNLAKTIAKAALQAALFGQGPLGGMFGGGGILSFLFPARLADGGYVSGPGSARSDSIPARLSNGEFVVNAGATSRNRDLLEAVNSGKLKGFASGGIVSPAIAAPFSAGLGQGASSRSNYNISAPITIHGSAGTPEQNNDLANKMGKQFESVIKGLIVDEIMVQKRPGNLLGGG